MLAAEVLGAELGLPRRDDVVISKVLFVCGKTGLYHVRSAAETLKGLSALPRDAFHSVRSSTAHHLPCDVHGGPAERRHCC